MSTVQQFKPAKNTKAANFHMHLIRLNVARVSQGLPMLTSLPQAVSRG